MGKDANRRLIGERLDAVNSYVDNRKSGSSLLATPHHPSITTVNRFPKPLARSIRTYFRRFYEQRTAIDENQILQDLSNGLRVQVSDRVAVRGE